ncbi:MAG: serine protein kinase RIO [Nitrososphaerales archaeon]|nr:serine protein kinase RIO [Nitrososphaerales archaeon]
MEADDEQSSKMQERMMRFERETRYRRKDADQRKVMEEVFDRATLLAVEELVKKGQIADLHGVVAAGKESRVYYGVSPRGPPVAVKIYLTASAEFKKRLGYIAGDRRFGKLPGNSREIIYLWVRKEFKNLQAADSAGIRVPRPHGFYKNIVVMEYIGEPPKSAPLFVESEVDGEDYKWTFDCIARLYGSAGLVHADLSEYNIFKTEKERILFDMGSAVLTSHPQASEYLRRDVSNMVRFFMKRGIFHKSAEAWLKEIVE